MTRVTPLLISIIFLISLLMVPSSFISMNVDANPIDFAIPSQGGEHTVRVAIYDEDNTTTPVDATVAFSLTNNVDELDTLLEGAGHEVTLLTTQDILNHELMTADYDVFVLVNNLPRENIAHLVYEFWLGGGGLLSFNFAFSYLAYQTIIWPELTWDGYGIMWGNLSFDVQRVSARHPAMQDYHLNDTLSERSSDWVTIADDIFDGSPVWSYITPLLRNLTYSSYISAFAMDSRYEGGRVVHLPGDGSSIPTDFESIIVDSIEWLTPRPKGRIVFDLSHQPRLSVDPWDSEFATTYVYVNSFSDFRTLAVNHTYTFDKLYPSSSGNLTAERLAKYDVLVIDYPDADYTSAERAAVEAWVAGGGSLLVLGDRTGIGGDGVTYLNQLLQNFDMSLGTTDVLDFASMTPGTHVTLEGCTLLAMGYRNYLSVIGNATAIWFDGSDAVLAGEEFGQGRAILSSDQNIFDNGQLGANDNERFALNVLNWLTATNAETLVFTDYFYSLGYRDPVCLALNDLRIPYQLLISSEYIDDFLDSKTWGLFILNEVNFPLTGLELDAIYAYVDDGGKLLMSYYDMDAHPSHPLWSKLGVTYSSTISGAPTIYIWDTLHPVFTEPNDHSENNYTSGTSIGDDGDAVAVDTGFTALAGISPTAQEGNAAIVVSNDKQTLFNPFLIDNFVNDDDDSTYEDRIELWQNEIVYINTPPGGGGGFLLDTTTLIIIGAGIVGVIVIAGVLSRRRSGGSASAPKSKKKKTTKKK
ncbi:MAG: DUF4350 domain-containing protein [Candidatus Sifarchaeia archaeon]